MVNKEIARQFNLLANLMELHGENTFKTRAYSNAFLVFKKWDEPLDQMIEAEIDSIPGIASSVIAKTKEYLSSGKIEVLEKLKAITPEGIQQLLSIKGLGPKKVRQIWDELKVESPAELLYACNENRLVKLSGFGLKTQEDIRQKISYFLESAHQLIYGNVEAELNVWLDSCRKTFPEHRMEWVGEMARLCPVISKLELLVSPTLTDEQINSLKSEPAEESEVDNNSTIEVAGRFSVFLHGITIDEFNKRWCELIMSEPYLRKYLL